MEYRKNNFIQKFTSASEILNSNFEKVISIKFRENVQDYQVYTRLKEKLKIFANPKITELNKDFQGKAYLVSQSKEKVIIVEHESGLEILYIAGSIASLVGIIPLIVQIWKSTHKSQDKYDRHYQEERLETEIRYFNNNQELIEEREYELFEKNQNVFDHGVSKEFIVRLDKILSDQSSRITYLESSIKMLEEKIDKLNDTSVKTKIKRKPSK